MHDYVAIVNQHPARVLVALDVVFAEPALLSINDKPIGDGPDVRIGGATGYDEVVRNERAAADIYDFDILGLFLGEDSLDDFEFVFGFYAVFSYVCRRGPCADGRAIALWSPCPLLQLRPRWGWECHRL